MRTSSNLAECTSDEREPRVVLNCAAMLTESDGCMLDVLLVDVSQHGFRVRSLAELEVGSEVVLQLLDARPFRGEIRWACGHEAGGRFLDPIAL